MHPSPVVVEAEEAAVAVVVARIVVVEAVEVTRMTPLPNTRIIANRPTVIPPRTSPRKVTKLSRPLWKPRMNVWMALLRIWDQ